MLVSSDLSAEHDHHIEGPYKNSTDKLNPITTKKLICIGYQSPAKYEETGKIKENAQKNNESNTPARQQD